MTVSLDDIKAMQKVLDEADVPLEGRKLAYQNIHGETEMLKHGEPISLEQINDMPEWLRTFVYEQIFTDSLRE